MFNPFGTYRHKCSDCDDNQLILEMIQACQFAVTHLKHIRSADIAVAHLQDVIRDAKGRVNQ